MRTLILNLSVVYLLIFSDTDSFCLRFLLQLKNYFPTEHDVFALNITYLFKFFVNKIINKCK